MEYSRTAREVVAPNGQRFIVDWAAPRHVEKAFGAGRWGVEVMQRHRPFGMLVVALMRMAGDLSEQSDTCPRGLIGNDSIRLPGRKETRC